jgi:hypothetical protein
MSAAALKSLAAASVTALSLLAVPSGVGAATVPLGKKSQAAFATDFLTQTLNATPSSTSSFKPLGLFSGPTGGGFIPASTSSSDPFTQLQSLGTDSPMSNLVALVVSQQSGRTFDYAPTSLASVYSPLDTNPASAVPLPASAWLFVMGLMGLLGTRVTGIGRERSEAADADTAVDINDNLVNPPDLAPAAPHVPRRRPSPPRATAGPYGSAVPA